MSASAATLPKTFDAAGIRRFRLERVRQEIVKRDLAAVLLFDPVNIRYASGSRNMQVWTMHNACRSLFVPAAGPVVPFELATGMHLSRDLETIDEIRPALAWDYMIVGPNNRDLARRWAAEIADLVIRHGGGNRRLGLDRGDWLPSQALAVEGIAVVDGKAVLEHARAVKSRDEIAAFKASLATCEAAVAELRAALKPGLPESEALALLIQGSVARSGGAVSELLPQFPAHVGRLVIPSSTVVAGYQGYAGTGLMRGDEQPKRDDEIALSGVWPWLVCPILPLLGGLVVLNVLYAEAFTFAQYKPVPDFIEEPAKSFVHFQGLVVYASVAYFHVVLCIIAIVYYSFQMRAFPKTIKKRMWRLIGALLLLLIGVTFVARFEGAALELTYRNTCELLRAAAVAPHIVPETCRGGAMSLLFWLTGIPVITGLIAAVFAAAVASVAAGPLPKTFDSAWQDAFARRAEMLQQSFYGASVVLVTSTLSIMLFLQLPSALLMEDPETKLGIANHAQGMTVFWGTIFTLTLLAIFAPSVFLMNRTAHQCAVASETPSEVRDWVKKQIAVSVPKRLGSIAAVLAPLLVGPAGTLLEKLGSGG